MSTSHPLAPAAEGPLLVERRDDILVVRLNRPDDLNAADRDLHTRLAGLCAALAEEPGDVGAVVLTGNGRAFSAGGDFGFMNDCIEDPESRAQVMGEARRLVTGLIETPVPVVAAVNGPAVGLGCSLVLLSDIVVMAPRAFLADPHLQVGLAPGDGGLVLPLHVGLLRAKQALLLGERIRAEDAVAWGLAGQLAEDPLAEALVLAERVAALPRTSTRATKTALNLALRAELRRGLAAGHDAELAAMGSPEHAAAVAALRARS